MSADIVSGAEWRLVVEQRGEEPSALDRSPYFIKHYSKGDGEKALKALADWKETKQKVIDNGAEFMKNWSAHIETRTVTETPWERLGT